MIVPAVFIPAEETEMDWVAPDIRSGAELLMAHLLSLGHRRIGFVNGVVRPRLTQTRRAVYCESLANADIPLDDALIRDCGPTMQNGYEATLALLSLDNPPTAIWTINDHLAVGALRAVQSKGLRVPEDVAVAGFDDTALAAQLSPPLTTVRSPARYMGQRAAHMLLQRIAEPECAPMRELLTTELVVRHSTDATRT